MSHEEAKIELAKLLERNGCLRLPNAARRVHEGPAYKKGYEVRFLAMSWEELDHIREMLAVCSLKPGQPYVKHSRIVQPVYGRQAVELFLEKPARPARKSTATPKKLIHQNERNWLKSLPAERRKTILMREFYYQYLAGESDQADSTH